jgi:outer membrane protein OmpA-like peptidoglycan-associated protein
MLRCVPVRAVTLTLIALGWCAAPPRARADDAPPTDGLGQKDPGLHNLKGTIYFLPEETDHMPDDLATARPTLAPHGVIYADHLDVPERDFSEGFPGVTDRFEWFGIVYTGRMQVETAGTYHWRAITDDGIILWIDGKQVMANDSIHAPAEASGDSELTVGVHTIKIWYFQGPATQIALQLWLTPPGGEEKIFSIGDYAKGLDQALVDLGATATPEGIKVALDAAVLFDFGKDRLKPAAKATLAKVAAILASYPDAKVRIEGHTDSVAADAYNLKLSQRRAVAVKKALVAAKLPKTLTIDTAGFGETRPIADNATEAGRAKNRRVEVYILP